MERQPRDVQILTESNAGKSEGAGVRNGRGKTKHKPIEERFWDKVQKTPDCWVWTAATNYGYGVFGQKKPFKKTHKAHRFSFELANGPIPEGLVLDHLCRNRACVRPDHLEPVTLGENLLRGETGPGINARKTHCTFGHEFSPENTFLRAGKRYCKMCTRARDRIRKPKKTTPSQAEINRAKTHCPSGHPYSGDNLSLSKCGRMRSCKACKRLECVTRRQRNKTKKEGQRCQ